MKATAGEVYTVYNQYLKRYTACQVAYIAPPDSVSKQPWAVILSLDWVGDAPLTAEELPHLRPLYKDFMYWSRDLHLLRVPLEVPPQYKLVGTLPSFTDQPCRSYGGWSDGYDVYLQIRWQAIPEERRRAFKEAAESDGGDGNRRYPGEGQQPSDHGPARAIRLGAGTKGVALSLRPHLRAVAPGSAGVFAGNPLC